MVRVGSEATLANKNNPSRPEDEAFITESVESDSIFSGSTDSIGWVVDIVPIPFGVPA
jgi:hypothetical protein